MKTITALLGVSILFVCWHEVTMRAVMIVTEQLGRVIQ